MSTIRIIHTNDMHGRLEEPAAARLRELRERYPGSLLVDAGDAVSAGNLGFRLGGEPILERMSELGYTAMTLGNRETHPRKEIFPRKLDRARFPVLCANLEARGGAPLPVRQHCQVRVGPVRVTFVGVTVPMFTRKQWTTSLCDYWFAPPIDCLESLYPSLRADADVVVALTHIGYPQDCLLAERVPGLDLLIGGHSHTDLEAPASAGGVPILQAKSHGFYAGVAELEFAAGRWGLKSWEKVALRPARRPPGPQERH